MQFFKNSFYNNLLDFSYNTKVFDRNIIDNRIDFTNNKLFDINALFFNDLFLEKTVEMPNNFQIGHNGRQSFRTVNTMLRNPDLLSFHDIYPFPYYNRISTYLSPYMSNFVFDSYEFDRIPLIYLNNILYTRYHRHKLLPPELILNGDHFDKSKANRFPVPSLFIKNPLRKFPKARRRYSKNKRNRFATGVSKRRSYFEYLRLTNFIRPHWSWWKLPVSGKFSQLDSEFNRENAFLINDELGFELERKYSSINNQLLRPYDIILSRIPDLKFNNFYYRTQIDNSLFYNDECFEPLKLNLVSVFDNNLPFESLEQIITGSELSEIDKWNWSLIRNRYEASSFLDFLRSSPQNSEIYNLPSNSTEYNDSVVTFSDLKRRGVGWRPRYFYFVPNRFRSIIAFANNYNKSLYTNFFDNLDSNYKIDDFKEKQIFSRNPSLSFLFIYKFLTYSDHFSYFDPIYNNFIDIFQEDDQQYSNFVDSLEEYLDVLESLKDLGFDEMLIDNPVSFMGKYKQSSYEIEPITHFAHHMKRREKKRKKRKLLDKNRRKRGESRIKRAENFIKLSKVKTGIMDESPMGLLGEYNFREVIGNDIMRHKFPDKSLTRLRRNFKRVARKASEEVLVLNSIYAFVNVFRKILRFIIVDLFSYFSNLTFISLNFVKLNLLVKVWVGKWLNIFSIFIIFMCLIIWVYYRRNNSLIVERYKDFSSYILDSRPKNYFKKIMNFINRWRLFIISKSFGLIPSKDLPFVGSKVNEFFLEEHMKKNIEFRMLLDSVYNDSNKRSTFSLLFHNIKQIVQQGMLDLQYKIREIQLLHKDKLDKEKKHIDKYGR